MSESIIVATPDGAFNTYIARASDPRAPAVVVLHEIFGINADMRARCHELANEGYTALCPDLFWRLELGVDLSDQTEAEWKKGLALYTAFKLSTGISDIAAAVDAARSLQESNGRVGITGYCLGGLMTFLATAKLGADAAAIYYPGGVEKHLGEADKLSSPLLMHLAEEDEYISKAAQQQIVAALEGRPGVEVYSYPGCNHAFARHRGIHFDARAAELANRRTSAFLAKHLKR